MRASLSAFGAGLLFGVGLVISGLINPAKVLAFLDISGGWDPSLALVMTAAVLTSSLGYILAKRLGVPIFAPKLVIPSRRDLDIRLLTGAILFGVGWGLVGLCPGPAVAALWLGYWQVLVFMAAMMAGMVLFEFSMPIAPWSRRAARDPATS